MLFMKRDLNSVLTEREYEIAVFVASGLTNKQIADKLFLSVRTVKAHLENIFKKLKIHNRVQLVVMMIK